MSHNKVVFPWQKCPSIVFPHTKTSTAKLVHNSWVFQQLGERMLERAKQPPVGWSPQMVVFVQRDSPPKCLKSALGILVIC